jgi:cytochrome P450
MTIDTAIDADLPPIAYEHAQTPEEAHELILRAREHGPIAMGPHGPEVLSYDLVRTVLRDDRFAMPKGIGLAAQGITSGELWDISIKGLLSLDGEAHHRQRRLVSNAFTPKAAGRLRATCADVISELLMAGTDTTRNQLAAAVQVFCDHPDQWAVLAEHPELAPKAVEETMRFCPVISTTMRIAVDHVDLAGVRISAGTPIDSTSPAKTPGPC